MLGARGPWVEKRKAPLYEGGTHNLEIGGLIGAPLNGKRFWRKQSGHTQQSSMAVEVREKPPWSRVIGQASQSHSMCIWHWIWRIPDRMTEIAPDRQKWNRQGIKTQFKGIWNLLNATVEKETNWWLGWRNSDGDAWLLLECSCWRWTGNPKHTGARQIDVGERGTEHAWRSNG